MIDLRDVEALQLLAGTRRRGAEGRQAVRIDDLKDLLLLPDTLSASEVSGSVTDADFNALLADMKAIHKALVSIRGIVQGKLR